MAQHSHYRTRDMVRAYTKRALARAALIAAWRERKAQRDLAKRAARLARHTRYRLEN